MNSGRQPQGTQSLLGQYVTVSVGGSDRGAVYIGVRHDDRTYVLHPMLPSEHQLRVGQLVHCTSGVAGRWTTTVRATDGAVLELHVPRWLKRSSQRRAVRVAAEHPVWLYVGGEKLAGRLRDLSLGGAAVMLERRDGLTPGLAVRCSLPPGDTRATLRSVRAHEHPLLLVVGLSWEHLDVAHSRWIGSEVAAAARRFRAAR